MSAFCSSMIFIGVLFIIVSLISIFFEKRKGSIFIDGLDKKKQELTDIIIDAEQMLEELNRFSDYIVSQIDSKNEELNRNIKEAEEKVCAISTKIRSTTAVSKATANADIQTVETETAYAVNSTAAKSIAAKNVAISYSQLRGIETLKTVHKKSNAQKNTAATKKEEKIIPFNNRYTEVLNLAAEGLESVEIARKLNMGKGEVELIIGLRK